MSDVQIIENPFGKDTQRFLDVVDIIYRDDPNYVRPLDMDMKDRLNPKSSPFFQHGEGVTFVAQKNGRDVGRITAHICRNHLALHNDNTGFFGFFDSIDDEDVAKALVNSAREWLRGKGLAHLRGPMSLSTNDEIGLLVDGFDTPPMVYMPHHRTFHNKLLEATGLKKEKDLLAWKYTTGNVSERARRAHEEVIKMPEVRIRSMRKKDMQKEIRRVMEVFNDAWQDNWGFVPMTEAELTKLGNDLKLLIVEDIAIMAEVDGEPAAISIVLPNVNEIIGDLHGKLFPLNIFKLLWRLKVKGTESARLALLGVKKKYRIQKRYMGLSTALYVETNNRAEKHGIKWGECSWTLEDNHPVNLALKMMGAKVYKTYRLYIGDTAI